MNKNRNKISFMRGFTLVEAIVAIAIISLMSVFTVTGYGDLRNRSALNRAAQKTALDIRQAQNLATATVAQPDGSVFCGYGIHYLDADTYILFTDKDCSTNRVFNSGEEAETINIEQPNIKFDGSFSDILFFPPDPVTFINGAFDPGLQAVITLCVENNCDSYFKRINVWGNGRIDIE